MSKVFIHVEHRNAWTVGIDDGSNTKTVLACEFVRDAFDLPDATKTKIVQLVNAAIAEAMQTGDLPLFSAVN